MKGENNTIMNICVLSGELARDPVVKGADKRLVLFTVTTKSPNGDDTKERIAHVPCVVFNPTPELELRLTSARKGTPIELEGRISTSSFEANGERRYVTEVVAFNRSLALNKN